MSFEAIQNCYKSKSASGLSKDIIREKKEKILKINIILLFKKKTVFIAWAAHNKLLPF